MKNLGIGVTVSLRGWRESVNSSLGFVLMLSVLVYSCSDEG